MLVTAASQPANGQAKLTRLHDVLPGSSPNTFVGTEDGSYLFLGEGGQIAMLDASALAPATAPGLFPSTGPIGPGGSPLQTTKVVRVGELGVVPADLMLDPSLCFCDDGNCDGDKFNDCEDLLFIAGGRLGLWVMGANPTPGAPNPVVRLDDQQDPGDPQSVQDSVRFCNQLERVTIGGVEFLAATFAAKDDSMLRLYRLDVLRALVAGGAPETGAEVDPFLEIPLTWRVMPPASQTPRTFCSAYSLGIAVDQDGGSNPQQEGANVYLAMSAHGLLRLRLDPVIGSGGMLSSIVVSWAWGPVFGTGTPYAAPGSTLSPSFPPERYENLQFHDASRSIRYDELVRSEPPLFLDVAVQPDGPRGHYLYASVDHLNWVRFDLDGAWSDAMPIDHHEGVDLPVQRTVEWSGVPQPTSWSGHVHVAPIRTTLVNGTSTDPELSIEFFYCRRLSLVEPPAGSSLTGPVLAATYAALPWAMFSDVVAPRGAYTHSFYGFNGVSQQVAELIGPNKFAATVVYDTGDLTQHYPQSPANDLGFMLSGGGIVWAPPVQDPVRTGGVDRLMILHDGLSHVHAMMGAATEAVCLSYFDAAAPPQGPPTDFYQRDEDELLGRYTFSIGWSESDPRVLYTGANDDQMLEHDGALWTELDPSGEWRFQRTGYTAGIQPNGDRRMVLGLSPMDDCQWEESVGGGTESWFVGRVEAPGLGAGGSSVIRWGLFRYSITAGGVPTVVEDDAWFLGYEADRWGRTGREGGYDVATVNSEAHEAWVASQHPASPERLAFYARAGTADNVVIADRDLMVAFGNGNPSGAASLHAWRSQWTVNALNCHPEYDCFPNDPSDPDYTEAQQWWNVAGPPPAEQGASLAWGPRTVHIPDRGPGKPEGWLLAVPCFYLSHAPGLDAVDMTANPTLEARYDAWIAGASISTQALIDDFDKGLVQFWDLSDPFAIPFEDPLDPSQPFGFPEGSSPLPKIVFPEQGSSAYELEAVTVTASTGPRVLLVCADFGGSVLVYDITDVKEGGSVPAPLVWNLPERLLDSASYVPAGATASVDRWLGQVWSIAVDEPVGDQVRVYAGAQDIGVVCLTVEESSTAPGTFAFDVAEEVHVETPGIPFRVDLRPAGPHGPKALLLSDGVGGLRVYGEELP